MRHHRLPRIAALLAVSLILAVLPSVTNADVPQDQALGVEVGRLYTHWPSQPQYHGIEIGTVYVYPAVWAQGQRIDVTLQVGDNMAQEVCTDDTRAHHRGLGWIRLSFKDDSGIAPDFDDIHHPTTYDGHDLHVEQVSSGGYDGIHWTTPLSRSSSHYPRLQPGRYGFSMSAPQSTEFAGDIEVLGDLHYSILTPHPQFGPCWSSASHGDARFVPTPIVASGSTITASAPTTAWGAGAKVTATVTSDAGVPTGRVAVTGSGGVSASAALVAAGANGRAVVTLPRSVAVGRHRLTVRYTGDGDHAGALTQVDLTITKASVRVAKPTVTKKPTSKTRGKVKVVVKSSTGTPVTGKVTVTLKKGKTVKKVTATLKKGTATARLPKLSKGTWRIAASFAKSTTFQAGKSKTSKVRITR